MSTDLKNKLKQKREFLALSRKTQFTRDNMLERLKNIKKKAKGQNTETIENKIKLLNTIEDRQIENSIAQEYPNYD